MARRHNGVSNLSVWMQDQAEVYAAKKFANDQAVKAAALAQAQAAADAAELEGVLQAEYRDAYETRRDALDMAVQ